jgi:hypothetical protein
LGKFIFTNDHKTEFNGYVSDLYGNEVDKAVKEAVKLRNQALRDGNDAAVAVKQAEINGLIDDKNDIVALLTEAYFEHIGEMPDYRQLDRLSTWIIRYVEHDDAEYDVETDVQRDLRGRRREIPRPEIFPRGHTIEQDGNRKKPTYHIDSDLDDYEAVQTTYDLTEDKRKYNAAPPKTYQIKK